MADLETRVDKLDERVSSLERQVSNTMTKVDTIIGEMRDRDNQRAQENSVIQQEIRDRDNQRAEDIREIRASLEGMGKHVRNMAITSMAAIGAMVITVVVSLLKN